MKQKKPFRAAALAALIVATMAAPAAAQKLRVNVLPIFDTAPFYAAQQEGYFKQEGLDVTTETTQGGGAVGVPGLAGGFYDVLYSNSTSLILALHQGIDVSIIIGGGLVGTDEYPESAGLLKRKSDADLKTGKDFEGKSIGIIARMSLQSLVAREWVRKTGGDPDKVTYREVPVPQMIDGVKSKQIDAALSIDPFFTVGQKDPALELLAYAFRVATPRMQVANWAVTGETAEKRREVVQKFLRGMQKGSDWINANLGNDAYVKLINSYTRMNPALIKQMPIRKSQLEVNVDSLERMEKLMRAHAMVSGDIDLGKKVFKK